MMGRSHLATSQAMTEPNVSPPAIHESTPTPAEKPASFWEDLIDIFFDPADVFRRRERASPWPAILTVTVLLAVFTFANANVLQPIFDAEFARQTATILKNNPQVPAERMQQVRSYGEMAQRFGAIIGVPIAVGLVGMLAWLLGKLFGSKQTLNAAFVVVAYSFMPRV